LRIRLVRSGGFAGLRTDVSVDAASLPPAEAAELAGLVERMELPAGPRRPRPSGADRFQYDLAIVHGGKRREASLGEAELTPELEELVRRVLELGGR
jgi:hypothetical protein